MQFEHFAGNAALKSALAAAFSRRRLPHAIILQGEAGCGKHTLARILARAAVCRSADRESAPCGLCPSCVRALAGSHPDIREITGSGASGSISAESAETVLRDAYKRPEEADCSVYLFFIENGISDAAQNKLLKLIEEPPPGVIFIFTVPSADILLPTIRSRAQTFTVRPLTEEEAASYIQEKSGLDSGTAKHLAALYGGNLGRMFQNDGGAEKAAAIAEAIALAVVSGTEHELLAAAAPLLKDKPLFLDAADRLRQIFRDACMLKSGADTASGASGAAAEALKGRLPLKSLMQLCDAAAQYASYVARNANMALLVTAFCAKMREIAGK